MTRVTATAKTRRFSSSGVLRSAFVALALIAACKRHEEVKPPAPLQPPCALAAGNHHTCARKSDGTLYCWGQNITGQLGDGTTTLRTVPTAVTSLGDRVDSMTAGISHTCAILRDRTLHCWGDFQFEALGFESRANIPTPHAIADVQQQFVEVSGRDKHVCARRASGEIACWGFGDHGQLGRPALSSSIVLRVDGLPTETQSISANGDFSCAVDRDGFGWCWGGNTFSNLGDGTTKDSTKPVRVKDLEHATQIAVGHTRACARLREGTVRCFGAERPIETIAGLTTVDALGAGGDTFCARKTDRSLWCFGKNDHGQLGTGDKQFAATPKRVLADVESFAVGLWHACAQKSDGSVWCWGENQYGQLGDGSTTARLAPTKIAFVCR